MRTNVTRSHTPFNSMEYETPCTVDVSNEFTAGGDVLCIQSDVVNPILQTHNSLYLICGVCLSISLEFAEAFDSNSANHNVLRM